MMIPRQPARSRTRGLRLGTEGHWRRQGITLIEVLVVMSGLAIVLGLCAITIQLLFRLDADGHARLSASASFARLASQFREDVHASEDIAFPPPEGRSQAGGIEIVREPAVDP